MRRPRGCPERRTDRADRRGARRPEPRAQQQGAVTAHRPAQEPHPRGVQALIAEHRDQLVEHHRARVLAGCAFVPITSAAVDRDHRERRQPGRHRLGETLFHPAGHHSGRILSFAVQGDHRAEFAGLARWARDRPVGVRPAACGRYERATGERRGRPPGLAGETGAEARATGTGGAGSRTDAEAQDCATGQVGHAGHLAIARQWHRPVAFPWHCRRAGKT